MTKRGMKIVNVDDQARAAWLDVVEKGYPRIRGTVIPEEFFDETLRLRDEFRTLQLAKQ